MLTELRLTAEKPQPFAIQDGNWDDLRGALEQVFYDGGTDLAALRPTQSPALLFSDGQSYHSRLKEPWSHPVTLIDSTGAGTSYWIDQAIHSGGRYLNLTDPDGQGIPVSRQFTLRDDPGANPAAELPKGAHEMIATLWASEKLRTLETRFTPDQKAILAFGKKHHLVSDVTSLIVLERFEDHVRYHIPPPEKDLLAKYQRALELEKIRPTARQALARQWKKRNDWHSRDFPWQNHVLAPSLARLAIWERALHKTFEEEELNQDSLQQVAATRDRVKQLQAQKSANEIQDLASYQAWLQELNQTIAQLGRLETLAYGVARDGKMPIAVNGFVNAGGKFLAASDTNLKAALQEAGGISKIGSPTRVSVYRGARKTTYNLLSKEYTPVPLKPGDLIVVEQARPSYDDSEDFFAAEPFPSIDYRNEPAVVIPSRSPNYEPSDDSIDGFAAADPFAAAGGSGDSSPASLFNIARMENPEGLDFNELKETLAKAPDPWAVYRQLRPESHYPDSFYLQWGDLLLDSKKPKLAHRVLSNLIETPGPRPTAYRKWAYLLAKHQDWAGALDLLDRAARQAPNDLAIVLDQAWLLEQQGNEQAAAAKRKELVENLDPTDPPAIKIAEIANAEIPSTDEKDRLPLDLRIVVSCASGQSLDLSMGEPSDTMTHFDEWPGGSKIGARTLEAVGVAEYTLRQAVPGPYRLSYRSPFPQLVRLQLYRNWGRDHQTCEEMIILLPASQTRRPLASFRFDLN